MVLAGQDVNGVFLDLVNEAVLVGVEILKGFGIEGNDHRSSEDISTRFL
jgi:hypothetical protein